MKKLGPEWVKEFLGKKNKVVTLEEAEVIYRFMKKLARISINQYLNDRR